MSISREDIDTIINQGRVFKAIIAVAEEIKSVEQIDQLTGEANARLSAKQDELAALDKKLATARAAVDNAQAKASAAKDTADNAVEAARLAVQAATDEAKANAAAIVEAAKTEAAAIRADAAKTKSDAAAAAKDAQAKVIELNEQAAAAAEELVDTNRKLDTVRATIKQMMGG